MGKTLVTGGAGFIGSHVALHLAGRGDAVTVLDNFDPYYDPAIKRRTAELVASKGVTVIEGDLRDAEACARALEGVEKVIHLAARPGVRASVEDPKTTLDVNLMGTLNLLQAMREGGQRALVFASSSSVYGGDATAPFKESQPASQPLSPYAASKRAGEHVCASYCELFEFGVIALRFFTVYGPRGRPDMSIGKFAKLALEGKKLPLYGDGSVIRDFTYVDDIVAGVVAAHDRVERGSGLRVSNIGGGSTATMKDMIDLLAAAVGTPVEIDYQPAAQGDMPQTHADLTQARDLLGFRSTVSLQEGIRRTVEWMRGQVE